MIDYYGSKIRVKINKDCLKQWNKLTYSYGAKVNIYIVYELGASSSNDSDPTLKNFLFGAVTLTKNADIEKYGYSGFGITFDRRSSFSFPDGGFGKNVLIFGVDISFSAYIDNKEKDILVLGKGPTQGLEHTSLTHSLTGRISLEIFFWLLIWELMDATPTNNRNVLPRTKVTLSQNTPGCICLWALPSPSFQQFDHPFAWVLPFDLPDLVRPTRSWSFCQYSS